MEGKAMCTAAGCTNEAKFVCPYCHQEEQNHSKDIPNEGRYCSKECCQRSWPSHKTMHKPATTEMSDLAVEEMLAMTMTSSSPIGRQRSRSTSAISCRYCETVDDQGNPIDLNGHDHPHDNEEEEELEEQEDLDTSPIPPPVPDHLTVHNPSMAGNVTEKVTTQRTSNIIGASYHNLIPPLPPYLPNYYPWRTTYPQLQLLVDHIEEIKAEARTIHTWIPWPEDHYAKEDGTKADWTVFPFLHTFPALDDSKMTWIGSTNAHCPVTSTLLHQIPGLRTALFSRLGPKTKLSLHTGWEDLANHVLRCHLNLDVPTTGPCGLFVDGEVSLHVQDEIVVFDDSKSHGAFNDSPDARVVLIVDLLRPPGVPVGRAKGGHTKELDQFVAQFK